jgi:CPA1 family monovalent cation:H+ antiporter
MGILKTSGAPGPLQTTIVGESLFNDGTAVVVFSILLGVLTLGQTPTAGEVGLLFLEEAVGGVLFGLVLGFGVFLLMRRVDEHQPTVMLTLALVFGGSALATYLHVSAPISMVVAGLIIGNQGRRKAMDEDARRYVDGFWELVDEVLNALLFALIGLELLVLPFGWLPLLAALLLGAAVLASRFVTVASIINLLRRLRGGDRRTGPGAVRLLTWGGLRGGVSLALALSLPLGEQRDLVLTLTYLVVLMSILLQGLTVGRVVCALYGRRAEPATDEMH